METTRQNKIARLLQKELSEIFVAQTRQMHGVLVSVSKCRISPDLSVCRAYLSVFPSEKAEEIVGLMGYTVRFVLDDGAHVVKDGTVQKNIGGLLLQINDLMSESKRLEPLAVFLRLHGKSIKQVASDIGVTPGSLSKYFHDDDMYLSRLFWIADAYGWKVQVKVDRMQGDF